MRNGGEKRNRGRMGRGLGEEADQEEDWLPVGAAKAVL